MSSNSDIIKALQEYRRALLETAVSDIVARHSGGDLPSAVRGAVCRAEVMRLARGVTGAELTGALMAAGFLQ